MGHDDAPRLFSLLIPGALARIEPVIGGTALAGHLQILTQKQPAPAQRAALIEGNTLQQVGRIIRRCGNPGRARFKRAQQEEFAVVITDVNGAEHGVGVQRLGQSRQLCQALLEIAGGGNAIMGQYPDHTLGRQGQSPRPLIEHHGQLTRRVVCRRHQCCRAAPVALHHHYRQHGQHTHDNGPGDQPLNR